MAASRQHLQLSILDRLDQEISEGIIGGTLDDVQVVRNAVLRDVENLLNTRRTVTPPPESQPNIAHSLYTYGIDDFATQNPRSTHVQKVLETTILESIAKFEPRLKHVQVQLQTMKDLESHLCFTVRAMLHADPVREPILFDTWFSASRGEYKIDFHKKVTG